MGMHRPTGGDDQAVIPGSSLRLDSVPGELHKHRGEPALPHARYDDPKKPLNYEVVKADFDSKSFNWQASEVYDLTFTDSDGSFTLGKLLVPEPTKSYSIIVLARGYLPITTDGLLITDKTKGPLVLQIEMSRD